MDNIKFNRYKNHSLSLLSEYMYFKKELLIKIKNAKLYHCIVKIKYYGDFKKLISQELQKRISEANKVIPKPINNILTSIQFGTRRGNYTRFTCLDNINEMQLSEVSLFRNNSVYLEGIGFTYIEKGEKIKKKKVKTIEGLTFYKSDNEQPITLTLQQG